jgi:hypothetical protein
MQQYFGNIIMSIKVPYMRKNTPTFLTISAIAIALLLSSPPLLSNPLLLQPVQAQTTSLSFRTPTPANGMTPTQQTETLTFDAQGTASSDSQSPNIANITNGTIQLHYNNNTSYSGTITNGTFTNTTTGGDISFTAQVENQSYLVTTPCTASDSNSIILTNGDLDQYFLGAVECSPSSQVEGGNTTTTSTNTTTTQSSSMT